MVNGQISKSAGRSPAHTSAYATGSGEVSSDLEPVSKLLCASCHLRLNTIHGQKHVIIEV